MSAEICEKNAWDKKAKTYARFSEKLNEVQAKSFARLKELGLEFSGKSLLDVGCGTGVWSLHLARMLGENGKLTCLDSSKTMLEILSKDALNLGLKNIECVNLSFAEFCAKNPKFKCDIAFLSMSPALQGKNDFKNFINLAPKHIYLGFASKRKSDFLDPLYKYFNTEFKGFCKDDLEEYLLARNLKFEKLVFSETRVVKRSKEEAIENALWHLNMNDIALNKGELSPLIKDDIVESIKSEIKLLIF